MSLWIIEPRDPLIVRDGRPFGPDPGARAASLPFPFPATLAGGVRHKVGMRADGTFDETLVEQVRQTAVYGPLLVALESASDHIAEWYAPAPADALLLEETMPNAKPTIAIKQLVPLALPLDAQTNLPDGLVPVGMVRHMPNKPFTKAPHFWRWMHLQAWLSTPHDQGMPQELGIRGLANDTRTHVSIRPQTQTAEEGLLFQTRGLAFTISAQPESSSYNLNTHRLALAMHCDSAGFEHFAGGFAPLGGERRLMRWFPVPESPPPMPPLLAQNIADARACRIVLLTPAVFEAGYRPTRLLQPQLGVTPQLIGAAVPRMQVISGWDMAADNGVDTAGRRIPRGKPKPTRRLAPAGSVYFVRFGDSDDPDAIARWVSDRWLSCISDEAQDQRDGFGLAVCGIGPREPVTMEVVDET